MSGARPGRSLGAAIVRVETALAGALLLAMAGLIFAGGVARLMRMPLNWTIDLATCFFAWAAFLGADVAWRRGSLMRIDLGPNLLPAAPRRALLLINHALIALFLVYLIVTGLQLAWVSRARSFQGIPWISYSWVTMSLPVGAALLLATTIGHARAIRRGEPG